MTEKVGGIEYEVEFDLSDSLKARDTISSVSNSIESNLSNVDKTADKTSKKLNTNLKKSSSAFSGLSKNAGQAGIQIQQFVGQVQGGQSAMLALSQQAADLGIVLGLPLVGAIAGLAASLAGPLYTALTNSSDLVEDFTVDIDKLAASISDLSDLSKSQAAVAIIDLNKNLDELSKEAIQSTESILKLSEQIDSGLKQTSGRREVKLTKEELEKLNEELLRERANLDKINQTAESTRAVLIKLTSGINTSKEATKEYNDQVDTLASSLQRQVVALEQGEEAAYRYAIAQELGLNAAEKLPEAIDKQINKIFYLKSLHEASAEAQKRYDQSQRDAAKAREAEAAKQITLQKELIDITDRSFDRMSSGIANVLVEGGSVNEMFHNISKTILTELLTSMIRVGIQQLINASIAQTASKATAVSISADNAAIAASAAPAAALQSTATFGASAIIGGTALLATLAIAKGAGKRTGGNVGPGMMHEVGEDGAEMLTMGNKQYLIPGRNGSITPNGEMGGGGSNVNISIINNTSATVSESTAEDPNGNKQVTLTIDDVAADIRGRGKIHQAMVSTTTAQNRAGR